MRYRCRLRLSPRALRLFPSVVPSEAVGAMLAGADAPDREGWREVELQLESEEVAAEQLTALGAGVEVLEPAPLRRRLHEVGRLLAARNARSRPRRP
ncbi:MAG: WYL domain-containing protein [Myxococcota bacterium]|nr:WYL domain-containing protein [Myxococcota bacterium]